MSGTPFLLGDLAARGSRPPSPPAPALALLGRRHRTLISSGSDATGRGQRRSSCTLDRHHAQQPKRSRRCPLLLARCPGAPSQRTLLPSTSDHHACPRRRLPPSWSSSPCSKAEVPTEQGHQRRPARPASPDPDAPMRPRSRAVVQRPDRPSVKLDLEQALR